MDFSGGNSRTYSVGATVVYGDFPTFCPTDFIYDAGVSYNPINCLTGAVGLEEVQLDANHQYPDVPFGDCPPNPGKTQGATNHGGATGAQGDNPAVGCAAFSPLGCPLCSLRPRTSGSRYILAKESFTCACAVG